MMTAWDLPTTLEIGGVGFSIRTDFRVILDILRAYSDPDLEQDEKALVCLELLYVDYEQIPEDKLEEAMLKAVEFIDMGQKAKDNSPRLMDWEHDAAVIIPEVNKNLGYECRNPNIEVHWWTFLGAYMGIGEGLYSNILNIRSKRAKGKKLEKYEKEFEKENKDLIKLPKHLTEEQMRNDEEERERLEKILRGE